MTVDVTLSLSRIREIADRLHCWLSRDPVAYQLTECLGIFLLQQAIPKLPQLKYAELGKLREVMEAIEYDVLSEQLADKKKQRDEMDDHTPAHVRALAEIFIALVEQLQKLHLHLEALAAIEQGHDALELLPEGKKALAYELLRQRIDYFTARMEMDEESKRWHQLEEPYYAEVE